jgi:LPXTG-motif cell wall-anchored protein
MKRIKKLASMIVSLMMILGMGIINVNAASPLDKTATITIDSVENGSTVKLYKIWKANYNASGDSITSWQKAEGTNFADNSKPTAEEINTIAAGLQAGSITALDTKESTVSGTTYTYDVNDGAGAYIAVITSPNNSDTVYNPILLSVKYAGTSTDLSDATINTTSSYLYGAKTVAKSSKPEVNKEAEGTTDKSGTEGTHVTGGVGDVIKYTVDVTIPVYPSNAKNKTLYAADNLTEGLTFKYETLKVKVGEKTYSIDTDTNELKDASDNVIGTAKKTNNGFEINFDYDKLDYINPVVTYDAVINNKAVIGMEGNDNTFTLYYANNPTTGNTYTTLPPQDAEDVKTKKDEEKVYTYQISFKKTDDSDEKKPLAGAVFGIYKDRDCTKLVDTVTTNANGYASSTQVGYGTYYVKEITAPAGYTLNSTVFEVTSSWATVTTKSTSETVTTSYTSNIDEATVKEQAGWLKDNVFYSLDNKPEGENVAKAYIKNTTTTTASTSTFTANNPGAGVVLMENIINTKNPELPSTGGMGTVIFTVLGAGLITLAVVLKLTRKKRS